MNIMQLIDSAKQNMQSPVKHQHFDLALKVALNVLLARRFALFLVIIHFTQARNKPALMANDYA